MTAGHSAGALEDVCANRHVEPLSRETASPRLAVSVREVRVCEVGLVGTDALLEDDAVLVAVDGGELPMPPFPDGLVRYLQGFGYAVRGHVETHEPMSDIRSGSPCPMCLKAVWGARTIRSRPLGPCAGTTPHGARRRVREPGMRGARPHAPGRTTVADPRAPPGPDLIRRDLPSPVPTTRPVGGVPYLRAGQGWPCMAAAGDLRAHGAGPGLPRAHGGRPADRRARAVPGARLRRARRDLSLNLRQPARTRGDGRPGGGARRGAARRRDGIPPRQRRRRAVLRHVRERDVPPSQLRHPQGGATRISRVRRGILQPQPVAPRDRLPHP